MRPSICARTALARVLGGSAARSWLLLGLLGLTSTHALAAGPAAAAADVGAALAARDPGVRPGADFYRYTSGAWLDRTQIPDDQPAATSLSALHDEVEGQIRQILEAAAQSSDPATRKAGDLYASWMDQAAVERKGLAPLEPYLDRIRQAGSASDLARLFADPAFGAPIAIRVFPDPARPTRYAVFIGQGGLGLPTRDDYLAQTEKAARIRQGYRAYVAQVLSLAGMADAAARADAIVALETRLAQSHWDAARSRDIRQVNNPMSPAQLEALAPEFGWPELLARLGVGKDDPLIVGQPSAVADAGKVLASEPLSVWQDYLVFHFIRRHAQFLPQAFDQASFDFFQSSLRGVPKPRARWQRGVEFANASLGETVGRLYAQRHFSPETERQARELVGNLRAAFAERIQRLAWMDDPTRKAALAKLDALDVQIGHPASYADTSGLVVRRDDLLGNAVRAERFAWSLDLRRMRQPVDRTRWTSTPQTLNGRYNVLFNQVTLPAAILQPPLFTAGGDPALNYGAIGALIGHEIGHAFDDQGRRFDATGQLRDWWTPASAAEFERRAAALKAQYDAFEPLPGLHVNGALTLGENIGDLGGLEIAYAAYRRHVAAHGEPPVVGGLTGDQRFFLGFAQVWRAKARPGFLRELVLRDPHAPPQFRVDGPVRNVDAWYAAFGVAPGDPLYLPPEHRVHIW